MKNLVLLLVFTPIFLITALNFYGGNEGPHHNEANRFTCTSCHASIVDGIIIGGKEVDIDYVTFEVIVSDQINFQSMVLDMQRKESENTVFSEYTEDILGEFLVMNLDEAKKGKRANRIKIQHEITEEERAAGFIEIQGVFTNLDGTIAGDLAFSQKIGIENEDEQKFESIILCPSVANQFIKLENLSLNSDIQIFNAIGQQVFLEKNTFPNQKIDISSFENGNYFVLVNQKDQLRFIVSK